MTNEEFLCFVELLICCDPWPVLSMSGGEQTLKDMANREAQARGFDDWTMAYCEG